MQHSWHRHRVVIAFIVSVMSAWLGACGWFGSEPERRARTFIEALVSEPGKLESLHAFVMRAPGVDPLAFTTEAPMRVALEYLRAKHRSGEALDYSAFETARPNQDARRVAVRVRIGDTRPAIDEVLFLLELERETGDNWLITHASVMP